VNKCNKKTNYVSQAAGVKPIVQQFNAQVGLTHFREVDWCKHRHPKFQIIKHRWNVCIDNDKKQWPVHAIATE